MVHCRNAMRLLIGSSAKIRLEEQFDSMRYALVAMSFVLAILALFTDLVALATRRLTISTGYTICRLGERLTIHGVLDSA